MVAINGAFVTVTTPKGGLTAHGPGLNAGMIGQARTWLLSDWHGKAWHCKGNAKGREAAPPDAHGMGLDVSASCKAPASFSGV
jgi:hypothetical protein